MSIVIDSVVNTHWPYRHRSELQREQWPQAVVELVE